MSSVEEQVRSAVSIEEPWALVERFSTLIRESGTEDERTAAHYIAERLAAYGVKHTVHTPRLYISLPKEAQLILRFPDGERAVKTRPAAMGRSTEGEWWEGEVIYIPTGQAKDINDIFGGAGEIKQDVRGKIVMTEGIPFPGKVAQFQELGVKAMIFIAPGPNIHEAVCTQIWGSPDLHTYEKQPKVPVLAVNAPDGKAIAAAAGAGSVSARFATRVQTGWVNCPLVEAIIPGTEEPEKFVLLHGHIDSWYVGIGDNATGDATLLELARVLHEHRRNLKRSVRICWWPGHSHGRYAGSTWYTDAHALDLEQNCIVHLNCDSPGCRAATVYENVMWMPEAEEIARGAIRDVTGLEATYARPLRAGDISFNNLGVSTFFMLLSTMPQELVRDKELYAVGGCGGNNEWHTEFDTLEVADREILLKDIRIYATAAVRAANAPVIPLDYRRTVDDLVAHLRRYCEAAGGRVSFEAAFAAAEGCRAALDQLYRRAGSASPAELPRVNEAILRAGRHLVAVGFAENGKFRQDPALGLPPIPAVAPALQLAKHPDGSHLDMITRNHVRRGINMVVHAFREAAREASL